MDEEAAAGGPAAADDVGVVAPGHDDDRDIPGIGGIDQFPADAQTVGVGQPQIEKNQAWAILSRPLKPVGAGVRGERLEPLRGQTV